MSLEQKIEELSGRVAALTEILTKQVGLQEAIVAGQQKAVSLMGSTAAPAADAPKRGRPPKAAEEPKAAEPTPAPAKAADPEPEAVVLTQDDLKKVAMDWRNSLADDKKPNADAFFRELAAEFGVEKFMGPTGVVDPGDIKRAIFYIDRKRAGKAVDFKADYDFDGSPEQDATPAPAANDDPFGD